MCGLVGFTSNQPNANLAKLALDNLSHRGPDSQNFKEIKFGDSFLYLGSTRLCIRGDNSCNMPLGNDDGDLIIYNGEIFDIKSLSDDYILSSSKNDTWYLLDFLSSGKYDLNDINGMFAFAYLNKKDESLVLARDRLGIKPLWYGFKDGEVYFASEQNVLINLLQQIKINDNGIHNALLFNGLGKNNNIIDNVYQLQPGHQLTLKNDKSFTLVKYIKPLPQVNLPRNDLFYEFEKLMLTVLEDHLDADTEVDLFLSGGIDSSILAYLIKNKLKRDVRHFSVKFENHSFDESKQFKTTSNILGLEPTIFTIDNDNIPELVNEALDNMNSLVLDPSFVPTFLLCKNTAKYTKAVISGDGADEVFGGYEWYRAINIKNYFPLSSSKVLTNFFQLISKNIISNSYLSISDKLNLFSKYLQKDPLAQIMIWQSPLISFNEEELKVIKNTIVENYENILKNEVQNLDLNNYMHTNILPKIDIAGMANGLEIRPPYLDDRIIKFQNSINVKNNNLFKTKLFLREYIKETDIKFLNKYKKHGFSFPLNIWFETQGRHFLVEMMKNNNNKFLLFEKKIDLDFILKKNNLNNNELRLAWSIFVIIKWIEKNEIKTQ